MARCPSCGSQRIRNGYRLAPLPLRALGVRELLCDYCNRQFRAFSPRPPKQRYRPQTASRSSASRANSPEVAEAAKVPEGPNAPNTPNTPNTNAPAQPSPGIDEDITSKSEAGSQSGPRSNNHRNSKRPPCPQCHSQLTYRRRRSRWERMALAISGKRAYVCESCGESFYAAPLHMEEEMSR